MPSYHIASSVMGWVEAREGTPCEEAGREMQPRARDSHKDTDLIILRLLKFIRKQWKEAGGE